MLCEIPAVFAMAVTARVDEILKSGNPSIKEMRSLLELVDQYAASLPSLTDKPWAAALMRLYQANRDVAILDSDSLAMTPDGELAGRVELSMAAGFPSRAIPSSSRSAGKRSSIVPTSTPHRMASFWGRWSLKMARGYLYSSLDIVQAHLLEASLVKQRHLGSRYSRRRAWG